MQYEKKVKESLTCAESFDQIKEALEKDGQHGREAKLMTAKPRIAWLDVARAFAIVCVVLNHAVEATYALNVKTLLSEPSITRFFALAMFTCGRLGVPIFFFLSGYLLLDVDYDINAGGGV